MATGAAVVLFVLFGLCMAVIADSYHSLIAECTSKESRAGVISVVWVVMILSTIFSAVVMNAVRPEFTPEAMQTLYNLTPPIVMTVRTPRRGRCRAPAQARGNPQGRRPGPRPRAPGQPAGICGTPDRHQPSGATVLCLYRLRDFCAVPAGEPDRSARRRGIRRGIKETTRYQPIWGGGILLGMVIMGVLSTCARSAQDADAVRLRRGGGRLSSCSASSPCWASRPCCCRPCSAWVSAPASSTSVPSR
jgi:BCD family chlorophyll transporter-like MFS transporter